MGTEKEETDRQLELLDGFVGDMKQEETEPRDIPEGFEPINREVSDSLIKKACSEMTLQTPREEEIKDPRDTRYIHYSYFNSKKEPIVYVFTARDSSSILTEYYACPKAVSNTT